MSWTEAEQNVKSPTLEMREGVNRVTVIKVMRYRKDGSELCTGKGPVIGMVLKNERGEEAYHQLNLTEAAKGFVARALSRLGLDLKRMDAAGITLQHWEDEAFAQKQLLNRSGIIRLKYEMDANGKRQARIDWFHQHEIDGSAPPSPAAPLPAPAPQYVPPVDPRPAMDESDIPFSPDAMRI